MKRILLFSSCLLISAMSYAIDGYQFAEVENEKRYHVLTKQLLCPTCDGQTLAESNSPIAQDLRRQIYQMLESGQTDEQITNFLTERYGGAITSKTPVNKATYFLWMAPILLLLGGGSLVFLVIRKHRVRGRR